MFFNSCNDGLAGRERYVKIHNNKRMGFFFNLRQIEINNNVMITSIRNQTEWSTIQGAIGRNFELDYR